MDFLFYVLLSFSWPNIYNNELPYAFKMKIFVMRLTIFLFLANFIYSSISGQQEFFQVEQNLAYHADVMVNASKASHRAKAAEEFTTRFEEALKMKGSFLYPFDSLSWISKVQPGDKSFRIFTWQLVHSADSVNYFGYFQTPENDLVRFEESKVLSEDFQYESTGPENWCGQVYTDILEYDGKNGPAYLLFGTRIKDVKTKQKLAEPLVLESKQVSFGEELFYNTNRHGKFRIIIEYFANARATLQYDDELKMIIFDHLIPVMNPYESNDEIYVPDGTLEGYKWEKGVWRYEDRIFNQIYDKPPVPQPILKNNDKNIFGK